MNDKQALLEFSHFTLNRLSHGILWLDENGKILEVNDSLARELVQEREDLIGQPLSIINPHTSRMSWKQYWKQLNQEKVLNYDTEYIRSDETVIPVSITANLLEYKGKRYCCNSVQNLLDVDRYKNLLEIISRKKKIASWERDLVRKELIVTEQFNKILQIDPTKEVGYKENFWLLFEKIMNRQQLERLRKHVKGIEEQGIPWEDEFYIRDLGNQPKWIRFSAEPVVVDDVTIRIYGTIQDITLQKQRNEQLYLSQISLENAQEMVLWIKPDGFLKYVNEAVVKNTEFSKAELREMRIWEILPALSEEEWAKRFAHMREHKVMELETEQLRKDGLTHPTRTYLKYLIFNEKEFICALVRNITKQRKREADLNRALDEVIRLRERLEAENTYLQEEITEKANFKEIISRSKKYRKVLQQVQQVAATDATVLILGETGTGKELLARAVHNLSNRNKRPMVKVNCAALPDNLIESELFGHEKGAFTGAYEKKIGRFELADQGTIFLDEIGEMPISLQTKLLRVLQEGEFQRLGSAKTMKVDVRVIAATNRNLDERVEKGEFREDLYYRLNVFPIYNIPLRERKDDIPLLIQFFVKRYCEKGGKPLLQIPQRAIDEMMKYDFPGNIRELENIIERAVVLSSGPTLQIENALPKKKIRKKDDTFKTFDEMVKDYIVDALKACDWRISGKAGAALLLDMNPKTLESKMRKMGIRRQDFMVK